MRRPKPMSPARFDRIFAEVERSDCARLFSARLRRVLRQRELRDSRVVRVDGRSGPGTSAPDVSRPSFLGEYASFLNAPLYD